MAARRDPVELKRGVDLAEVEVGTNLDGAVAGVEHLEDRQPPSLVEGDGAIRTEDLAGDHGTGWWMVTSFVPSGKVASTWISSIISATPSMRSSRDTT